MRWQTQSIRRGIFAAIAILFVSAGCTDDEAGQDPFGAIDIPDVEAVDISEFDAGTDGDTAPDTAPDVEGGDCELVYELPDGDAYALQAHRINEPAAVASLAQGYIGSVPPLLLFADGLSDGTDDQLDIVGGVGELMGHGFDETPGTEEDIYAMYYASINPDTCQYQARLEGDSVNYEVTATADEMEIDLSGFSSLTDGLSLHVEDVLLVGEFGPDLFVLDDAVLSGRMSDDGIDDLLEAVREQIPISKEQALELLDPDDTGEILIELELAGHRVQVEGFTDAQQEEVPIEPRPTQSCCPEGLAIGDSVIPYLRWEQQGIDAQQAELFLMALPEFRSDPHVAMVTTARRQADGEVHYEVYSGGAVEEGMIRFTRHAGDDGMAPRFEVIDQVGGNPLANTDPTVLSSYEEFLTTGTNPGGVTYDERGYASGDPRLGFIPAQDMHYPYAMERIAQNFDDPRTGDLIIIPATWSTGGFGTHGNLGALQSRSPLVVFGPGVRGADDEVPAQATVEELGNGAPTMIMEDAVRQVDIAPTVAAALGVEKTTGVDPEMRLSDDVYLAWQDGRVLDEIFTDEAWEAIEAGEPVASRAVVIINDGLTNAELFYQVFSEDSVYEVDAYREFFASGLAYRHGSISNFPSNTYPGHNTIGAGAWGGHHGVVDNRFWERQLATGAQPIQDLFETEHLMGSAHDDLPVETIHEAVGRSFGTIDDGVLSASINDPSSRGAEFATLERRHAGFSMPDEADDIEIGGELFSPPPADIQDYTGVMDNGSLLTFAELYQDELRRGEEGLPMPRFSIVNFGSTDSAGHAHGPHGDYERYEVISRVNQRMRIMLEVLEFLEIDDTTMVILTSDHGMELQDTSRSSSRSRALGDAGVSVRAHGWYYYFKELAVEVEDVTTEGDDVHFSLRVIDRATQDAEQTVGVDEIEVAVVSDGQAELALSDEDGVVDVVVTPDEGVDSVLFEFNHGQWNMHRQRLDW